MTESLVVRHETQIAASPATVLAFLTDPEEIEGWMGAEATTEPHPGRLYLVKGIGDRAHVERSERSCRSIVSPIASVGRETKRCPRDRVWSRLILSTATAAPNCYDQSGLPNPARCVYHDRGWAHYLGRLAVVASGRNPGIDRGPGPGDS